MSKRKVEEERCAASPLTPAAGELPVVADTESGADTTTAAEAVDDSEEMTDLWVKVPDGKGYVRLTKAAYEALDEKGKHDAEKMKPGAELNEDELKLLNSLEERKNFLCPEYIYGEVDYAVERAERKKVNVSTSWEAYKRLAYSLANELGLSGKSFFERLSVMYPYHTAELCEKVWAEASEYKNRNITIKTLIGLFESESINVWRLNMSILSPRDYFSAGYTARCTPLETDLFGQIKPMVDGLLPPLMMRVLECADTEMDEDLLLLGALTAVSSCLPHVRGVYGGRKTYSNLYLFVVASAASGKGKLGMCRKLVEPVDAEYRARYKAEKEKWIKGGRIGQRPVPTTLLVPANSSSVPMYRTLKANGETGLIFEAEADTLTTAVKRDCGKFQDSLRKAFHHEPISYIRYGEHEQIDEPRLSVILSGTPEQARWLMPSMENGLFSRFMFYTINENAEWRDVFAHGTSTDFEDKMDRIGEEVYNLYKRLEVHEDICIRLSEEHVKRFNQFFCFFQQRYEYTYGSRIVPSIRRMGLICYRIAMVLTILRASEQDAIPNEIVVDERDMVSAANISNMLMQHMARVQDGIPEKETPADVEKTRKQQFYERLGERFDRREYLKQAELIGISSATAARYIRSFELQGLVYQYARASYARIKKVATKCVERWRK